MLAAFGKRRGNWELLSLCMPAIVLFLVFNYLPMFGIIVAFKNYRFDRGFFGSDWNGINNFKFFFTSQDAFRITRNTVGLNLLFIVAGLIASVVFALMANEVTRRSLLKVYQTVMFFPYFLSWVVVSYMLYAFLNNNLGMVNNLLRQLNVEPVKWYTQPGYWPFILLFVYLWVNIGYSSVIYYAGIMGIDNEYYEAAVIDGASKLQIIRKITIPLISPIIIVIVLLQIGKIFYADFGMFYFLPRGIGILYPTTDVIDTYVYRTLRVTGDIGMASAAGFYQSIVGFLLVLSSNYVVRKINKDVAVF